MKKVIYLFLVSLSVIGICATAQAQFKPGTLLIGTTIGSTGYSRASSDYVYDLGGTRNATTKTYTLSAGPQIGLFITSRLVAGGTFTFNYSDVNNQTANVSAAQLPSSATSNTHTFSTAIGPFMRYYFSSLSARNIFYAQANSSFGSGTGSSSGTSNNGTSTGVITGKVSNIFNWNAGASVGMTHLFYHRIGMDFALGYNYAHAKSYNENTTVSTKISTGGLTTATNNYTLATATNGVTASVGFHFFLK